ncbi:MAG: hypothetical protein ACI9DJ_001147 [Algoriphagus sp.]|jgi:hypothetical protein
MVAGLNWAYIQQYVKDKPIDADGITYVFFLYIHKTTNKENGWEED